MTGMKSNGKALRRILATVKAGTKTPDWLSFGKAVGEVANTLGLPHEVAQATLFGLIAIGDIRAGDVKGNVIDIDDCTIGELGGKPAFVDWGGLRDWLRKHSTVPTSDRVAVIKEMLRDGDIPGRNVEWKPFYDEVRNRCGGWHKGRPARGFSDKQIWRDVKALQQR